MTVAFVVHTYFPNWSAGTEVYARNLAREAVRRGHKAHVICYEPPDGGPFFPGIQAQDREVDGVPVHEISFFKTYQYYHRDADFNQAVKTHLLAFLQKISADIVHVVHAMNLSTASIWAARELGLPVVATATDFWYLCPTYQLLKWDQSLCDGPEPVDCLACVSRGTTGRYIRPLAARPRVAKALSPVLLKLAATGLWNSEAARNLQVLADRPAWMRETLNQVDVLIVPSLSTAKVLERSGLRPARLLVSGYGIEDEILKLADHANGKTTSNKLRLGFVGTLRHSKGVHVLLEALQQLPADRVETLIFGGEGHFKDYGRRVRDLARSMPNVHFGGQFSREQLPDIFSRIDALVVPSIWRENLPFVILEAFAFRTPVIVSNLGGLQDYVTHGENGLVFEPGNPDSLAAEAGRLVDDPALLSRLTEGVPRVRNADDVVDEVLQIYEDLVGSHRPHLVQSAAAG